MKTVRLLWPAAAAALLALSACGTAPVPNSVTHYASMPIQCRTDGECQAQWARVQSFILKTHQEVLSQSPAVIETKGVLPAPSTSAGGRSPSTWTFSRQPSGDGVSDKISVIAGCGDPQECPDSAPDVARVKHYLITGLGF